MIEKAMSFIMEELDLSLRNSFQTDANLAVLANLSDITTVNSAELENKIVISVVNIGSELNLKNIPERSKGLKGTPPLNLNIQILFSTLFAFNNYRESLKLLDAVIDFFQQRQYFDLQAYPNFPNGLAKLIMELDNLSISNLNHLWSNLGTSYRPSVLYKARLIAGDEKLPQQFNPVIKAIKPKII